MPQYNHSKKASCIFFLYVFDLVLCSNKEFNSIHNLVTTPGYESCCKIESGKTCLRRAFFFKQQLFCNMCVKVKYLLNSKCCCHSLRVQADMLLHNNFMQQLFFKITSQSPVAQHHILSAKRPDTPTKFFSHCSHSFLRPASWCDHSAEPDPHRSSRDDQSGRRRPAAGHRAPDPGNVDAVHHQGELPHPGRHTRQH